MSVNNLPVAARSDLALRRYMEEVAGNKPLTSEEECELARRIKLGDIDARTKLVEANLRFVISVAREYQNRGVPLADLISSGNIGLITAAERFDETKRVKFISYAVWWIRQAVLETIAEHGRTVRLPINRIDLLRKIGHAERNLLQVNNGRQPTPDDIAAELDVDVKLISGTLAAGQKIMHIDAPSDNGNDLTLGDILEDGAPSPEELLTRVFLKAEVKAALGKLNEREAEVLRLYYGFGGAQEMTLEEIGAKFGLTRERARQIKEKALQKLRHPRCGKRLLGYAKGR